MGGVRRKNVLKKNEVKNTMPEFIPYNERRRDKTVLIIYPMPIVIESDPFIEVVGTYKYLKSKV